MTKLNPEKVRMETCQPLPACARGLALLTRGRVDEAREVLEEALIRSPFSIEVRRALARLKDAMGDAEVARELLEGAVQLAPRELPAVCDLALLYSRQRDGGVERACRLLEAALQVDPRSGLLHLTYARVVAHEAVADALLHARKALTHGDAEVREAAARLTRRLAS